jgi:hypothetical protein
MTFEQQMAAHNRNAYMWDHIEELVSKLTIERMVAQAIEEVKRTVKGSSAAYGWSGGSDSQALRLVCELAGVNECVSVITNLEFTNVRRWLKERRPEE